MFHLSIVTPEKIFYDDEVKSLVVPGSEGYLGILSKHAPLITALKPGKLEFKDSHDKHVIFAVSGGFLEVSNNQANLLVEAVEPAEEIDLERAQKAYDKALKKLREEGDKLSEVELAAEKTALEKAANRIKVYQDTH
ncbi:MAG: ATP synthase F1 subunit epsilon [FCB group bacterium]|nr:ATP synthase F1 subunit epsilon [FCB group bacterium]